MRGRGLLRIVLVIAVAAALADASSASAASPWFHLASVSRPGYLHAGGSNETQELSVTTEEFEPGETGALFELKANGKKFVFGTGEFAGVVPALTLASLRAALEEAYGAGNVEVTEKTGSAPGTQVFVVESIGADAGIAVPPITVLVGHSSVTAKVVPGGYIVVTAVNVGDESANGEATPVKINDVLPKGLEPLVIEGISGENRSSNDGAVACELATLTCTFAHPLPAWDQIEVRIGVAVEPDATTGELNTASVSGGGAPSAELSHAITVNPASTPFGVEDFAQTPEQEGGAAETQAGAHPFQFTTTFDLNQIIDANGQVVPPALAKDLSFKLPPGFIGNPTAYPRCTLSQFAALSNGKNQCPADSVLGVAVVSWSEPVNTEVNTASLPIFNLEPRPGEPARFGFQPATLPVFLDASIRTGEDYGVTVHVENILQTIGFLSNTVTFWGVPGDTRHADARGYGCLEHLNVRGNPPNNPCEPASSSTSPPFLDLPTSCTGELEASAQADSWAEPHPATPIVYTPKQFGTPMPAMDGCGLLPFGSEIKVSPDSQSASTPSGLKVDVHVPQEEALNPEGLAPANVKNITVALPDGLQLNPSAADGLQACTQEQVGLSSDSEAACPDASKIASVTLKSPLLPLGQYLKGFVYLASPQNFRAGPLENPFGSLVAMYLVAKDPVSGVLVKLPGSVSLSASGQITSTFANNPQLPFEDAEIEFFGGERAPLATPAHCGVYTTNAIFEPWSNTAAHNEALSSASQFEITSGANGAPCPGGSLPFAPVLSSESTNPNAGAFTPLSTTLSRDDGQQSIQSVTLHYPPGLSGILTGIPLCPEAQANAGTCGPGSLIGETVVSVGLGGDPFTVTGGKVYLTEKYGNAPFGLSIVNPAKAGPFDLQEGRPVIVRAEVAVDPKTAALTITTGKIPTIIEGFPLQIKHVNVTITRPGFTFNPTNCSPLPITGAINSAEGASSPVSVPFQVTNCAVLKFTPKFTVSTSAHTAKATGASLTTKLSEPTGALGTQANITKVKVDLPLQLPSQLKTLQKACLAAVFEANPAGCPPESIVGHAKVVTPLLPVPLTGPAYFVSHGGEAFPSLTIVLQGYGVTVDLVGATSIKKGITSTTFNTVPDTPFNTFELTLPQGKYAALAANLPAKAKGSLCGQNLKMPTLFVAQNGLEIHQSTAISVTGCSKAAKPPTRLTTALKRCHKQKGHKRAVCEQQARKKYGKTAKHKTAKH
jgi:hypothetical protein